MGSLELQAHQVFQAIVDQVLADTVAIADTVELMELHNLACQDTADTAAKVGIAGFLA